MHKVRTSDGAVNDRSVLKFNDNSLAVEFHQESGKKNISNNGLFIIINIYRCIFIDYILFAIVIAGKNGENPALKKNFARGAALLIVSKCK